MLGLFALNGGLNILWSALFFYLQRPDLALFEVGFLWLSVALLALHLQLMVADGSAAAAALSRLGGIRSLAQHGDR
jgi:benzodiazapine receptor